MNIGLFGGTFDPPHIGHVNAARAAQQELMLDRLILIPSGVPPHKPLPKETASPEHRLAMTKLCAETLCAEAWDVELDGKVHYTVDTVRHLRSLFPEDTLWLLVGCDMLATIHMWRDAESFLDKVKIGAFARLDAQERELADYAGKLKTETKIIPLTAVEISSTELRSLLAKGGGGQFLLPEVWQYIKRNSLYVEN